MMFMLQNLPKKTGSPAAMTTVSPEIQRLVQQLQGTEEEQVLAAQVLARLAAEASEVSEAAKDEIHLEIARAGGIEPLVATGTGLGMMCLVMFLVMFLVVC